MEKLTPKSDLSYRLGYKKKELPLIIPLSCRTIEDLISSGRFPKGFKISDQGHYFWDRKTIEKWWNENQTEMAA